MSSNVDAALAAARAALVGIDQQADSDATTAEKVEKGLFRSPAGKTNVVRRLLPLFPPHKRYVEPFAGGAAVFFAKEPVAEEVLNDKNAEIAFAYRFIKRMTPDVLEQLKRFNWTNRRSYFDKLKVLTPRSDLERFHKFIYINRFSYFSKGGDKATYNPAEEGQVFTNFDKFLEGKERLKQVTILSEDYEKVLRRYDGPETFFFLDPPFPGYDQSVGEKDFDEERFAKVLHQLRGKFLITYGLRSDRSLFKRFHIRRIMVPTATPKGLDRRPLLLIANYSIQKRLDPDTEGHAVPTRRTKAIKVSARTSDPLMVQSPDAGKRDAVLQYQFRGTSAHLDLRIDAGDKLIGWTLSTQQPGALTGPVDSTQKARALARTFSPAGDRISKSFIEPNSVLAMPKEEQPRVWLDVHRLVTDEGEADKASHGKGVLFTLDRPMVEIGLETPHFHEYFFTKGRYLKGRMVIAEHAHQGESAMTKTESGCESPEGPRWTASMAKSLLPAVLSTAAVTSGTMPPEGHSALPFSLEVAVPPELRYWETAGDEARSLRDALVSSRFFTEDNIRLVDGEPRRVVQKFFLYRPPSNTFEKALRIPFQSWGGSAQYAKRLVQRLPAHKRYIEPFCGSAAVLFSKERAEEEVLADIDPEVVFAHTYIRDLTPQRFRALQELDWKVSRKGFERARTTEPSSDAERFWRLVYGRLCTWGAKQNLSGFSTLHEGITYPLDELWKFHERLQGVKIYRQDWRKTLERFDGPDTLFFIDPPYEKEWAIGDGIPAAEIAEPLAKLRGQWVVAYTASAAARQALGKAGHLFTLSLHEARHSGAFAQRPRLFASKQPLRKLRERGDRVSSQKRQGLTPMEVLAPMRADPAGAGAILGAHEVVEAFAAPALLSAGIAVEPRFSGERVLLHKQGADIRVLPCRGSKGSRSHPDLAQALQGIPGNIVLDGVLAEGQNGNPIIHVFDAVYADRDMAEHPWTERQKVLARLFKQDKPGLVRMEPRIVHTEPELRDAIAAARNAPGSAGAVLKLVDSIYRPGATSAAWAEIGPESALERIYDRFTRLDQPIVKRGTDEERFTLGVVLEPDVVDAQGDRYTREEVRRACHRFAEFYWNAGLMHKEIANGRIVILENYLAPCEFTAENGDRVKEGTWLQGRGYRDDEIWARIKRGELTGLSMGGSAIRRPATKHEELDTTTEA